MSVLSRCSKAAIIRRQSFCTIAYDDAIARNRRPSHGKLARCLAVQASTVTQPQTWSSYTTQPGSWLRTAYVPRRSFHPKGSAPGHAQFSTCSARWLGRRPPTITKKVDFDMPISPDEFGRRQGQQAVESKQKQRIRWDRQAEAILERKGYKRLHENMNMAQVITLSLMRSAELLFKQIVYEQQVDIRLARKRLEDLLQARWTAYYEGSELIQLYKRAHSTENRNKFLRERFNLLKAAVLETNRSIDAERGPLWQAASQGIDYVQELKGEDSLHEKLKSSVYKVLRGALAIAVELSPGHLRRLEYDMIKKREWKPVSASHPLSLQDAAKLHRRGLSVYEVVQQSSDPTATLLQKLSSSQTNFTPDGKAITYHGPGRTFDKIDRSWFGRLVHHYRRLDLAIRQQKLLPEIHFSQYWSTVIETNYLFPLGLANSVLKDFLSDERATLSERRRLWLNKIKPGIRRGQYQRDVARMEQLQNILNKASSFTRKTDDIVRSHAKMLLGGNTSLCLSQHPSPRLYHFQHRFFGVADRMLLSLNGFNDSCFDVARDLETIRDESALFDTSTHFSSRNVLIDSLRSFPAKNTRWRREMRTASSEAKVSSSTRYLAFDQHLETSSITTLQSSNILLDKKVKKQVKQLMPRFDIDKWRPAAWLHQKSLYPSKSPILIDYVMSANAFAYVISDLRKAKVIAIDVSSLASPRRANDFEYIKLATEKQVVVVYWLMLVKNDLSVVWALLESILEDETILKVGECNKYSKLLWKTRAINLTNYIDVPMVNVKQDVRENFPTDSNTLLPVQTSKINKTSADPRGYFYDLAVQPYSILRAFHAMNPADSINTLPDSRPFDLTSTKAELREAADENLDGGTLGPVFVDRGVSKSFHHQGLMHLKGLQREVEMNSGYLARMNVRDIWLKKMGETMANLQGLELAKTMAMQSDSYDETTKHKIRLARSAYYQFTAFHENPLDIAYRLGMSGTGKSQAAECAAWILWVCRKEKLRLNDLDKYKLQELCADLDVEDQIKKRENEARMTRKKRAKARIITEHKIAIELDQSLEDHLVQPEKQVETKKLIPVPTRRHATPLVIGFKSVEAPKTPRPIRTAHELERAAVMVRRESNWKPKLKRLPSRSIGIMRNSSDTDMTVINVPSNIKEIIKPVSAKSDTVTYTPVAASSSQDAKITKVVPKQILRTVAILKGRPPRPAVETRAVRLSTHLRIGKSRSKLLVRRLPSTQKRLIKRLTAFA